MKFQSLLFNFLFKPFLVTLHHVQQTINEAESYNKEEPKQKISNIMEKIRKIIQAHGIESALFTRLLELKVERILTGEMNSFLSTFQKFTLNTEKDPIYKIIYTLIEQIKTIANSNPLNIKIIHIGWRHPLPIGYEDKDEKIKTIKSQLLVAKLLKLLQKKQNMPIVVEGLYEDLNLEKYIRLLQQALKWSLGTKESLISRVQCSFPDGIPLSDSECNQTQIDLLYKYHVPGILFLLGQYTFYKSIHPDISAEIDKRCSGSYRSRDLENIVKAVLPESKKREKEAIYCVIEAAASFYSKEEKERPVILIFGAGHDLQLIYNRKGIPLERIDTVYVENNNKKVDYCSLFPIQKPKSMPSLTDAIAYSKRLGLD